MPSFKENSPSTTAGSVDDTHIISALDQLIATGFRLWMLLAMIFGVLLLMMIIVCCFIKIRIPRSKREIELDAAMRRKKKICNATEIRNIRSRTQGSAKVIVMSSLPPANQALLSADDIDSPPKVDEQEGRRSTISKN